MKQLFLSAMLFLTIGFVNGQAKNTTIAKTKTCLIDFDWLRYSDGSLSEAWKFSKDGTFNYSSVSPMGSLWGKWTVTEAGKINLNYTRNSGILKPQNTTAQLIDCNNLKVNELRYSKEKSLSQ
jgi:hypothetical protein